MIDYAIKELDKDSIFYEVGQDITYWVYKENFQTETLRMKELNMIIEVLGRRTKRNPLLIGEPGVGKSFLIKQLAKLVIDEKVPFWIKDNKIIKTSFNDIMASLKNRDYSWPEYVSKLNRLLNEASTKNIVLFMDEIHYIGLGYPMSMNIIKPYLAEGKIKLIGATTPNEYRMYLEKETAFTRRFQIIKISEPDKDELIKILNSEISNLEKYYNGLEMEKDYVDFIIELSEEYIPYRSQPDKSIDILEQTFINCVMKGKETIEKRDIYETVSKITGIPIDIIEDEKNRIFGLESVLNRRILGQEEGIRKICERLKITTSKVQINKNRPLGIFLISGPSGVGKTEFAKSLALYFTGDENNLIYIDMSIYKTIYSLEHLLGITFKRDEYFEDPYLTKKIKQNPYSVLLLDEIDKAEPDVLSIFLQAFDQGKLTDYAGNEIYLNNLIILMTCNIGFERKNVIKIKDEDFDEEKKDIIKSIENYFTKEFLGRVDEIIIFNKLTDKIIDGFINQKLNKLIEFNKKDIKIGEKLRNLIKEYGFSNEYGARRLNNIIDKYIGKVLAEIKYKEKWDEIKNIFIKRF
jgi:ATP-dependent Clp protease ATP-binding subunit ClpA